MNPNLPDARACVFPWHCLPHEVPTPSRAACSLLWGASPSMWKGAVGPRLGSGCTALGADFIGWGKPLSHCAGVPSGLLPRTCPVEDLEGRVSSHSGPVWPLASITLHVVERGGGEMPRVSFGDPRGGAVSGSRLRVSGGEYHSQRSREGGGHISGTLAASEPSS